MTYNDKVEKGDIDMSKKLKVAVMFLIVAVGFFRGPSDSQASTTFILLNCYNKVMNIGDEFHLTAVASNGEYPEFCSSKSTVASVDAYGTVCAKKAGTAQIKVKVKGRTVTCKVVVKPTTITLSESEITMEKGASRKLKAYTSNGSKVTYKSNKTSVVTVEDSGIIKALKPGTAIITVTADKTKKSCHVTVKKPDVILDKSVVSLYCTRRTRITAKVSSGMKPVWKSSNSKVASVSDTGMVTALKPGESNITAVVDGVKKVCKVKVIKPAITLNTTAIQLKTGTSYTLKASCNYPDTLEWYTSNDTIVTVNEKGQIKAIRKGSTYVYAALYGVKVKCHVKVTK